MKSKDFLLVSLAPCPVLLIALFGNRLVEGWNWQWNDFLLAWVVVGFATFMFRLIATRKFANFAYKAGAALAVLTGFLVFWITAAVQIIGNENPANLLYLGVILTGLIGTGLARFQPAGMAMAAFVTAAVTFVIPIVGVVLKPSDFSPGIPAVFLLNGVFVLLFTVSGLLFRHAATRSGTPGARPTP